MSGKLEPNIKALAALGIFPALFPDDAMDPELEEILRILRR